MLLIHTVQYLHQLYAMNVTFNSSNDYSKNFINHRNTWYNFILAAINKHVNTCELSIDCQRRHCLATAACILNVKWCCLHKYWELVIILFSKCATVCMYMINSFTERYFSSSESVKSTWIGWFAEICMNMFCFHLSCVALDMLLALKL